MTEKKVDTAKAHEQRTVLIVIAAILLFGIVIYFVGTSFIQNWRDRQQPDVEVDEDNEEEENDLSGNKVVIQNETSQTAEGSNLPTDINFALMIPRQLGEENLIGVVDNKQQDSRNITLKYKLTGEVSNIKQDLVSALESINWTINSQTDVIMANQEDKRIALNIEQVDTDNVYVTVLLNLYDEPIN